MSPELPGTALIVEANQYLNLTRIVTPREASVKHVLDSVMPWQLFEGTRHVLDETATPDSRDSVSIRIARDAFHPRRIDPEEGAFR